MGDWRSWRRRYYLGKEFREAQGDGFKADYYEVATGNEDRISARARIDSKRAQRRLLVTSPLDLALSPDCLLTRAAPIGSHDRKGVVFRETD